ADERRPGRQQGADPRQRVALRLRRRLQHRRVVRVLPAQEDRPVRAAAHPHRARRRLHAEDPAVRALRPATWTLRRRLVVAVLGLTALALALANVFGIALLRDTMI